MRSFALVIRRIISFSSRSATSIWYACRYCLIAHGIESTSFVFILNVLGTCNFRVNPIAAFLTLSSSIHLSSASLDSSSIALRRMECNAPFTAVIDVRCETLYITATNLLPGAWISFITSLSPPFASHSLTTPAIS